MKLFIPFVLCTTILLSCSSNTKKERISTNLIKGTWLVTNVNVSDKNLTEYRAISISNIKENNQLLNLYQFDDKGAFVLDTGSYVKLNGNYKIEDSILTLIGKEVYRNNLFLTAIKKEDTTKIILYTDFDNNGTQKLVYEFTKLYDPELQNSDWKTPLDSGVTDFKIKKKMEALLYYYAAYFKALGENEVVVFSQDRVCLPINLYDGGVSTKGIDFVPGFVKIMGNKQNATKGLELLRKCFADRFKYPSKANLLLEYAEVLRHLATEMKNMTV